MKNKFRLFLGWLAFFLNGLGVIGVFTLGFLVGCILYPISYLTWIPMLQKIDSAGIIILFFGHTVFGIILLIMISLKLDEYEEFYPKNWSRASTQFIKKYPEFSLALDDLPFDSLKKQLLRLRGHIALETEVKRLATQEQRLALACSAKYDELQQKNTELEESRKMLGF
ncbi:MAG: hypothetical protein WCF93_03600 [Candidatus Moraniibacteriota bacterium]